MTAPVDDHLLSLRRRSRAQWVFRALLEDEANQSLSVAELCRRAGYSNSNKPWFRALKDEDFRAHLENIGLPVWRREDSPARPGPVPLADPDEVWRADSVDLRRLTEDYPKHVGGGAFKLVFTFINNEGFRSRITFWQPATFKPYLKHIKPFLTHLGELYPKMDSFAALTRAMIEPALNHSHWVDQSGKRHAISAYRRAKMAGVLDGMFTYMRVHDWPEAPPRQLIFYEDKLGRPFRRPRPIPESVMQQLEAHLHLLHPYARNLVEILRVAGLRAEATIWFR